MSNPTELPDLGQQRAILIVNEDGIELAIECRGDGKWQFSSILNERPHMNFACRAQPEGEAPQAVYQYRNKKGGDWIECSSDSEARIKRQGFCDFFEFRTLYTAPAATLSPLCGAQHAESGKESGSIEDYNEFNRLLDELEGAKVDAHACGNDFGTGNKHQAAYENLVAYIDGFTAHAVSRRVQAALKEAAQQAAAPVDCSGTPSSCPDNEGYGCHCSAPGTPEAPKGGA